MTANILFWDIENRPLEAYAWSPWPNFIPIDQITTPTKVMSWAARWYTKKTMFYMDERDGDAEMLQGIWDLLDQADIVVSWNGQSFDSKKIRAAFIKAGMPVPSPWVELDLMREVKRIAKFDSNKLDFIARELGVGQKTHHHGFGLWRSCMEGDTRAWALMKKYNKQDVNLLVDLFEALRPWIRMPNIALYNSEFDGCTSCGSTNTQKRGYRFTNTGKYQRFYCNDCGSWSYDPHRIETVALR